MEQENNLQNSEQYCHECNKCKRKGWISGRTKISIDKEKDLRVLDRLIMMLDNSITCSKCFYT